jgi:hypothetical protein
VLVVIFWGGGGILPPLTPDQHLSISLPPNFVYSHTTVLLFPCFDNTSVTSALKQNHHGIDSFQFCDTMSKKSVTTPATYSWPKEVIRFNAKDVVEPQESNRIDE